MSNVNQHREATSRRETSHEEKPEQAERFTRQRTQAEEMVESSRHGQRPESTVAKMRKG